MHSWALFLRSVRRTFRCSLALFALPPLACRVVRYYSVLRRLRYPRLSPCLAVITHVLACPIVLLSFLITLVAAPLFRSCVVCSGSLAFPRPRGRQTS